MPPYVDGSDSNIERLRADVIGIGAQLEMSQSVLRKEIDALRTSIHDLKSNVSEMRILLVGSREDAPTPEEVHQGPRTNLAMLQLSIEALTEVQALTPRVSWLGVLVASILGGLAVRYGPAAVSAVADYLALAYWSLVGR